jgi:murein DD-endopeptidase MepM/ murein hydrolase activator NlpD
MGDCGMPFARYAQRNRMLLPCTFFLAILLGSAGCSQSHLLKIQKPGTSNLPAYEHIATAPSNNNPMNFVSAPSPIYPPALATFSPGVHPIEAEKLLELPTHHPDEIEGIQDDFLLTSRNLNSRRHFQICSPLQNHPLKELYKIVSAPYSGPPPGAEQRHHGVDFCYYHQFGRDTIAGVPVQSVLPGKVVAVTTNKFPYGNMVIIETDLESLTPELVEFLQINPSESLYILVAHMQNPPEVALGASVEACVLLGEVGKSGNADVVHLHLETRIGPRGQVLGSMGYYVSEVTAEERATYQLWRTSRLFRHFDPMDLLTWK